MNKQNATAVFQDKLNDLLLAGEFQVARGMIVAAILLAQTDADTPTDVIPALVLAYTRTFDGELQSLITKSRDALALVGITPEYVKAMLTGNTTGGNNGTVN